MQKQSCLDQHLAICFAEQIQILGSRRREYRPSLQPPFFATMLDRLQGPRTSFFPEILLLFPRPWPDAKSVQLNSLPPVTHLPCIHQQQ